MKTTIRQIQGTSFAAMADSGHWTVIDTSKNDGGANGATGPMEMVLNALGCCSAIDVYLILQKMRAQVEDFQIDIEADRAEEHPRVFTEVRMEFLLKGTNLKDRDIERAIELSLDKYCSVAGMVSKTAKITTSYKILE